MNNEDLRQKLIKNLPPITHVLVIEDNNSRQTIVLEEANYSLGRDPQNSIVISSKKVSRFHATFLKRKNPYNNNFSYWILDGDLQGNRSTNGIFINNKRCLFQELKHEDLIKLGDEIQASYYIISNMSDLILLKSGDFQNQRKQHSLLSKDPSLEQAKQQTLIIPEEDLEQQEKGEPQEFGEEKISKLASFPELSPNPIIELDWQGNITYLNPAASNKFKELQAGNLNHPLLVGLIQNTQNYGAYHNLFVREVRIGKQVLEQYIHYLAEQKLIRTYVFDFTKRKQLETQLKESERRYRAVISNTKEGIFLVDTTDKRILEANNAVGDLLGYSLDEIHSLSLYDIVTLDRDLLQQELTNFLELNQNFVRELTYRKKDNSLLKLEASISLINYGDQQIFCFILSPIKRINSQETVGQNQGLYDLITGLPNQNLLVEQLSTAIANSQRNPTLICIIFLELESLQNAQNTINQSTLLEGFAKRLRTCLRSGDTVARWEDNQFVVLLPQVLKIKDIGKISVRILSALKPPFFIDRQKIYVETSMGIAVYPDDGEDAHILLTNAKNTLTKNKNKGTNKSRFYNQQIHLKVERLLRLEKLLFQALEHQEFRLHYQPQINIKTKQITAIEALLRWQHPELGLIPPEQFIPLAEETSLIVPIGEWVLDIACSQNRTWQKNRQKKGREFLPITVNLSSQQFKQPNLVALIKRILEKTELLPNLLELEITETTIMEDLKIASKTLAELNELGVGICLDDFGSGVSAVGYLKHFKFHTLKIAQSVVQNLPQNSKDVALVSALITLANSFALRVVAEGVETQEQLQLLSSIGCEQIQGNLFTQSLRMEEATNFWENPRYKFEIT
jgi:diguanylate cyclase (GGDEF)-like protein/PAS domain S-box-containing protein